MATSFLPTPAHIEAETAKLRQEHLDAKRRGEPTSEEREALLKRKREYSRERRRLASTEIPKIDDRPEFRSRPDAVEMTRDDICNVVLVDENDLCDSVGLLLDCVGYQTRMTDLTGRWTVTDFEPTDADFEDDAVPPYKPVLEKKRFRSAL